MATGARGNLGGVQDVNGAKTILPSNMSSGRVENALETMTLEQLLDPEVSGQDLTEKDVKKINQGEYRLMLVPETGKHMLYRGTIGNRTDAKLSTEKDKREVIEIDFYNWQRKYVKL